jgi:hypothetical protein
MPGGSLHWSQRFSGRITAGGQIVGDSNNETPSGTVLETKMKSSATACFETPRAAGIITLVWKFFVAHDNTPGTMKEKMWWNDVLKLEILVWSCC